MSIKFKPGTFCTVPIEMIKGKKYYIQIVFVWLCHHANKDCQCFPSLSVLSQECNLSKPTVIKAINELLSLGFLIKTNRKRRDTNESDSNLYTLLIKDINSEVVNQIDNVVNEIDNSGKGDLPQVVNEVDSNYNQLNKNHLTKINNNKLKKYEESYSIEFEQAWSSYPHPADKGSKPRTYKNWNNLLKSGIAVNDLVSAAMNYNTFCYAKQTSYRYKCSNFYGEAKYYESFILLNINNLSEEVNNETNKRDIKQSASQRGSQIITNYFAKRRAGRREET